MNNALPARQNWYAQLDGLRCLAIMLVLIEHYILSIGNMLDARQYTGRFGVNLFFIISGFSLQKACYKTYITQPN